MSANRQARSSFKSGDNLEDSLARGIKGAHRIPRSGAGYEKEDLVNDHALFQAKGTGHLQFRIPFKNSDGSDGLVSLYYNAAKKDKIAVLHLRLASVEGHSGAATVDVCLVNTIAPPKEILEGVTISTENYTEWLEKVIAFESDPAIAWVLVEYGNLERVLLEEVTGGFGNGD